VFIPISMIERLIHESGMVTNRRRYWAYLFARLQPGVSLEQARLAINAPYRRILASVDAPLQIDLSGRALARFKEKSVTVADGSRGQSLLHGTIRVPLTLLLAVTGIVLLIACVNIANLLLARCASRSGEMAIRLSIGAGRWRLVRQLLTESCLLAIAGGAGGLIVARWTLGAVSSLMPPGVSTSIPFAIDMRAMLFAGGLTAGVGLVCGLFPALNSTRPDLISGLNDRSGQPAGARAAARFRTALVTAQIALAMALLVSAGLFTRSLMNVSRIDLGLKADNVIAFRLAPGLSGYSPAAARAFFQRVERDLAALPGVEAASQSSVPVLSPDGTWGGNVRVEGFTCGPDVDCNTRYNGVGHDFFRAMGMPLLAGRGFTAADGVGAPRVAIVTEAFARRFKLGPNPVGKHLGGRVPLGMDLPPAEDGLDTEIVGLVPDTKYGDVKGAAPVLFFRPYLQDMALDGMSFYVRTALPPSEIIATIPRVIAAIDPNMPVEGLKTLPQQIRENVFLDRLITILSASFAVLATLLAAIGLYGVLAYTIAQRTREIGLRIALGADGARVRRMILGQVARMTLVGGVAGLAAAIGIGIAAKSLLFELDGYDPLVSIVSVALLALVSLSAGFVPALRASRIDPMRALRWE
jgi:predicted permease